MAEPIFHYDEESDTLYVSFAPGEAATGIALNDHMLLRINKHERRAIGLTLLDYSVLAQPTEAGPRSFPLTGLIQLSEDLRALVLDMLRRPPVCKLLSLSAYTPSMAEIVPIATLRPGSVVASDT
jgi:uncharacterized protein YuzE